MIVNSSAALFDHPNHQLSTRRASDHHPSRRCGSPTSRELDASRIVTGQPSTEVVDAVRAAAELAERVHSERAAHEAWKQELSADACARADSEGYCAEFDVFMVTHGLEGRSRPYSVQCTVTGTVRVQVQASTSEQAEEQVSTEDVIDALNVHDLEWEVDSVYTF